MRYKSFENMPVWREVRSIAVGVSAIGKDISRSEDCGLASELRRPAFSISTKIADSFGRPGGAFKTKLLVIARESTCQTKSHLIYRPKDSYITTETASLPVEKISHSNYEVNLLIKTLRHQIQNLATTATPSRS